MEIPNDKFSAAEQTLAYLYQVRYAFLLLLRANDEQSVSLELFDDVAIHIPDQIRELGQLKHHVAQTGNLSDHSRDLWKTIRIWSVRIKNGQVDPANTKFVLITTADAPEGSIASGLQSGQESPKSVVDKLIAISQTGGNETNQPGYSAFLALTDLERLALVRSVHIKTGVSNVLDLERDIEHELRNSTVPQKRHLLRERLEGWWISRAIRAMLLPDVSIISRLELDGQLRDLRRQLEEDALPNDFGWASVPETVFAGNPTYIQQIHEIRGGENRKRSARQNYYKAFAQRSRWFREELIDPTEWTKYEASLIEEWEQKFGAMRDDLDGSYEVEMRISRGRNLYDWIQECPPSFRPIRPTWRDPFLLRGSMHMLADELRVGWHPDFEKMFSETEDFRNANSEGQTVGNTHSAESGI